MYISIHHSLRFKFFVIFIKHPACPVHCSLFLLKNWVAGVLFLALLNFFITTSRMIFRLAQPFIHDVPQERIL